MMTPKTSLMMIIVLPRFRWFVWGFGLCSMMYALIDGYFSPALALFFLIGAATYPAEWSNRRLIQNGQRLAELDRRRGDL
jgi:hypothetical protein